MLKPPHPVARLAYALAMFLNPNNHALDGGRATSAMEKEAVARIAAMFGWESHLGHLTGGGTMANFEALWVGRELRPGKAVAASSQAHYTHSRLSAVLGVPFRKVAVDARGRMDVGALEEALRRRRGRDRGRDARDDGRRDRGPAAPRCSSCASDHEFRIHVDAAYGGYFTLAGNLGREARAAFDRIAEADSIVIDPHKHGLQPYGCGCVLFRDPAVGRFYRHDSPYTYFSSAELHLGEISLECSRAGAAAAALWATMRLLPPEPGGAFARGLGVLPRGGPDPPRGARGGRAFRAALPARAGHRRLGRPRRVGRRILGAARRLFDAAERRDLHLALATFPGPCSKPPGRSRAGMPTRSSASAPAP